MPEFKKGNLSSKEKIFIKKNASSLSIEEMSKKLDRKPSQIENYLESNSKVNYQTNQVLETLRMSHEYSLLQNEFNEKEVKIFEKKYAEWVGQFQEDILPSEKNQIFNTIKIEIIMSKVMQNNKSIEAVLNETDAEIALLQEDTELEDSQRQKRIRELREYRRDYYSTYNANISRYQDYQILYSNMLKELNASRGQRVKTAPDIKKNTFMDLIRRMLDDKQRTQMGEEAELERLAAEAEANKFKQTTTFLDGSIGQPFMSGKEE